MDNSVNPHPYENAVKVTVRPSYGTLSIKRFFADPSMTLDAFDTGKHIFAARVDIQHTAAWAPQAPEGGRQAQA